MIKTIVFDFGGVIAPLSRKNAVDAFVRIGLTDAEERLDQCHQTGIFQDLEEGRLNEAEFHAQLESLCGKALTHEEVQAAWMGFFLKVDTALLRYIENLRMRGYRLVVLSNTNPYVMRWACSSQLSEDGKGLPEYVDRMYLSFQMGYTKPAPQIFELLLEEESVSPAEMLFVDDGKANTDMANDFGICTLNPENGADWRQALEALLEKEAEQTC